MVRRHLAARGITDRRVLAAMASVPREAFLDPDQARDAYADAPLTIGCGQTISQPYIVALMTQLGRVRRTGRVLDVGTGSGYQAAILARLARQVWSIERIPHLAHAAGARLRALGIDNVTVVVGDGAAGWQAAAPYQTIVVAAAAPDPPSRLLDQLLPGGHLVIPVGDRDLQTLTAFERTLDGACRVEAGGCRFVPLVSPDAFPDGA